MKKILFLLVTIVTVSCASLSINEDQAKARAAELLDLLAKHQYDKTAEFYTAQVAADESVEERQAKWEQIEGAMGEMQSSVFVESSSKEFDGTPVLELIYHTTCKNGKLIHTLHMIKEGEKIVITQHGVTNMP